MTKLMGSKSRVFNQRNKKKMISLKNGKGTSGGAERYTGTQ